MDHTFGFQLFYIGASMLDLAALAITGWALHITFAPKISQCSEQVGDAWHLG